MGLSNFPSPAEGVLPVLVMNTVLSVALLKNMMRSVLQVVGGASGAPPNLEIDQSHSEGCPPMPDNGKARRVSITRFKSLCNKRSGLSRIGNGNGSGASSSGNLWSSMECCVCLCGFEADEEVSELNSCKHLFHKGCLEKWFDNQHRTCPLCRSIL